jgi:hypothetical protein
MTTSIAIYGAGGKNFVASFPEEMPLDAGMFIDEACYRYSIGTTDTQDTRAKMLYTKMLETLKATLKQARRVDKVLFSNSTEHVTLIKPTLELSEHLGEKFLEITANQVSASTPGWKFNSGKIEKVKEQKSLK